MGLMRVCATIDLGAVRKNIQGIKNNLTPGTKMILVVKANGYGHGAVPIAGLGEDDPDVWGYAVATCEEGIELREAGLAKPILILGYTFPEDVKKLLAYDITPAVFSYEMAEALSEAAVEAKRTAKIHLVVDTGMSRIGFQVTEEGAEEALRISRLPGICVEGVFTHFAKADEYDKAFTKMQVNNYIAFVEMLGKRGLTGFIKHVSNSAGIVDLPGCNMDMVRAGIILYGLYPSDEVNKRAVMMFPAMSLTSHVSHVKTLEAGRFISYGGTYETKEERVIATIPVGYADGYPRTLSNKGYVLINGQKAFIVGRVCMDQMMVDVTDIPDVTVGSKVTFIGKDGDACIAVEELGNLSGRFNYEFVCGVSARVPRVYKY